MPLTGIILKIICNQLIKNTLYFYRCNILNEAVGEYIPHWGEITQ
jgi:hypothetical protein